MSAHEDLDAGLRELPLGAVLSVTDAQARLFSPDGMPGIRGLLSHLISEPVYDNQLPRVIGEVRDEIFRQHPFLRDDPNMQPPEHFNTETVDDWLGWLTIYAGEALTLLPLRPDDHTSIDPRDEWAMLKGTHEGIISLESPDDTEKI